MQIFYLTHLTDIIDQSSISETVSGSKNNYILGQREYTRKKNLLSWTDDEKSKLYSCYNNTHQVVLLARLLLMCLVVNCTYMSS